MPETGTAAACSKLRFAGLGAKRSALAQAYSAKEPSHVPYTGSPGLSCGDVSPGRLDGPCCVRATNADLGLTQAKAHDADQIG